MLLPPETWFDDYHFSSGSPPSLRFASAVEYTNFFAKVRFLFHLDTSKVRKVLNPLHVSFEVLIPPPPPLRHEQAQGRPSEGRQ